jgi:ectoine hydroxylase-related dioxygenase (phytanoyl-CoA dioxygenase family)
MNEMVKPPAAQPLVTEDQIAASERDGVILLRGLLDAEWVKRMQDATDRVLANPSARGGNFNKEPGTGRFFGDLWMWKFDPDFRALAFDSILPDTAAQLMRSKKINLHWDQLLVKEPHTPLVSPWHQDQPYAWADGINNMSFWVALDDVTLANGAVEFIKGSHKGTWYQARSFHPERQYESSEHEPLPDFDAARDQYDIVHFDTKPGDVIAHHLAILHSAPGNNTDLRRRATAVRYCGDGATYAVRKNGPAVLEDPGITPGDPMDCDLLPVVRRAA